ncbi:MAG TPA: hypothetical protein VF499_11495 [Afipia sp.]
MNFTMRSRACNYLTAAVIALGLVAVLSIIGPFYRSFFLFDINLNEAWYAYHAQSILRAQPLYPSLNELTTNNYPPLSFYTLAALMKVTDNPIWAGRMLSFIALSIVTLNIFLILRTLSVSRLFAMIATVTYFATMNRLCDNFVWVNDYQMVAHAFMTTGLLWFVRDFTAGRRWYVGPTAIMALAGFFKHNLLAIPTAALLLLWKRNWIDALRYAVLGLVLATAGFVACIIYFGADFTANLFAARPWTLFRGLKAFEELGKVPVQFIIWIIYATTVRDGARGRVINTLVVTSALESIITRGAEEVHYNAGFDFLIALHLGFGAALIRISELQMLNRWKPSIVLAGLLAIIASRLVFGGPNDAFHVLYNASFRERIALAATTTNAEVNRVRALPGAVFCESTLICFLANKPFLIDPVNIRLRMQIGALPRDTLERLLSSRQITYVDVNPQATVGNR